LEGMEGIKYLFSAFIFTQSASPDSLC